MEFGFVRELGLTYWQDGLLVDTALLSSSAALNLCQTYKTTYRNVFNPQKYISVENILEIMRVVRVRAQAGAAFFSEILGSTNKPARSLNFPWCFFPLKMFLLPG